MKIKYTHTNINAYDWEKLSQFYKDVFGCYTVGPMRDLKGDWFEKVTGIKDAAVKGEHIAIPVYPEGEGPSKSLPMKYRMESVRRISMAMVLRMWLFW